MIYPKKVDPIIQSDIFCLINMSIFALTNGYATTVNMALAPQICKEDEKETAGFIMNFPLMFGILSGTFFALIF